MPDFFFLHAYDPLLLSMEPCQVAMQRLLCIQSVHDVQSVRLEIKQRYFLHACNSFMEPWYLVI